MKCSNALSIFCFFIGFNSMFCQNLNFSHEFNFQQRLDALPHSSLRPYNEKFHFINYEHYYKDSADYGNKLLDKLFKESLIDIKKKDVHLQADPLFNFTIGNLEPNQQYRISYNTRGLRVIGDLGEKLSFETRFYENQFNYPGYIDEIADYKGVALGIGRSKVFKTYGHDAGISSGYISYSPIDKVNFQFGHGRHFFGNGYRSLLLSDYASDYPYFSGMYSFLNGKLAYKHVTAWMHTLDRRPLAVQPIAPESLFKQKGGSFNMISFMPNEKFQMSLFEGVIHKKYDEVSGSVNPDLAFYLPVFGVSAFLNDTTNGFNRVYGYNISLSLINKVTIYAQGMMQNTQKWGAQLGIKYIAPFHLKNAYFLLEFNHIEPYSFTVDSARVLQSYSHNMHELAHPLGAGIDEIIFKSHIELKRWFSNFQFNWIKRIHEEFSLAGANIFLSDDGPSSNELLQDKWMYLYLEKGYLLNVQTRMQLYFGFCFRGGFDMLNEKYFLFGFRTNLKNNYFDQ